jgi:phytoene synthase
MTAPEPPPDILALAARAHEPDRYFAALLAPADRQRDLVALAAFAGEVGRIAATVSEPMIGAIRLQWWRDALARPDGEASGHPIADAMRDCIRRHRIDPGWIASFIDGQDVGLSETPPADDAALSAYFDATDGALFRSALAITSGCDRITPAAAMIRAAGQAYGRARMLAEFGALIADGRTLLPQTRLAAAGLHHDELPRRPPWPLGLLPLLDDIGDEAEHNLEVARKQLKALPRRDSVALLPLTVVPSILGRSLEQRRRGELAIVEVQPLVRMSRLAWTFVTGRL